MTTYTTDNKPVRKTYDSPRLVVYGNVREITRQTANGTVDDASMAQFHSTLGGG